MKKFLPNPKPGPSLVSFIILSVFIFFAIGSFELDYLLLNMTVEKEFLGNGKYKETEHHQHKDAYKTIEGKQDGHGRWHGQIKIQWLGQPAYMEEATMEHGMRQGLCTKTYYPNGPVVEEHYLNGIKYEYKKSAGNMDATAFQRLNNRYPWYLLNLNGWGFDDEYVKAFMDTIEARLYATPFEPWEFNDYYDEVISNLEDTPLDTLVELNSDLILLQGITDMKNSELRLAIIDRYRAEGNTIYNIINTTYPGYLVALNDSGIVNMDFEVFCQDLEDTLESYGAFDPEDPFYTDTVDSRLFRAMIAMIDLENSLTALSGLSGKSTKNRVAFDIHEMYTALNSLKKPFRITAKPESSSSEVAATVLTIMLMQLYESDMIRKAVREAYMEKMGILTVPTTATAFISSSSSGTIVEGYVLENGGAEVTERGIAWATHYNPTTGNTTEVPDTETGNFSVTIDGLTAGATYYARSFAINSAGTGYGNCISFVAGEPVGIRDKDALSADFRIYPNPAVTLTTFNFTLESVENVTLTIINAKGQMVLQNEPASLHKGENHVSLNLSGLPDGIYTCRITNGKSSNVKTLVIAH
jgi:hypothetical protein